MPFVNIPGQTCKFYMGVNIFLTYCTNGAFFLNHIDQVTKTCLNNSPLPENEAEIQYGKQT